MNLYITEEQLKSLEKKFNLELNIFAKEFNAVTKELNKKLKKQQEVIILQDKMIKELYDALH